MVSGGERGRDGWMQGFEAPLSGSYLSVAPIGVVPKQQPCSAGEGGEPAGDGGGDDDGRGGGDDDGSGGGDDDG